MGLHPTAVIHPAARLHPTVEVGPYAVIGEEVELGAHCRVGPHVHLQGILVAGERNFFDSGCALGGLPQDLRYNGAPTTLRIGNDNTFREHVTVHRSNRPEEETRIGNGNYLMAGCHVGHNCQIGHRTIIVNGTLLAGHVTVGDGALLSGNCLVHQFTRIGALALMQGGAGIGKDLPPYCISWGVNGLCGVNVIGLRRAGVDAAARLEIRRLYKILFQSGRPLKATLPEVEPTVTTEWGRALLEFVRHSKRGVLMARARSRRADPEIEE